MMDDGSSDLVSHIPETGVGVVVEVNVFVDYIRGEMGVKHVAGVRVESGRRSRVVVIHVAREGVIKVGQGIVTRQDITGVGVDGFFVWFLLDDVS